MRQYVTLSVLLALLLLPRPQPVQGQTLVEDIAAIAQLVVQVANQVADYANQVAQLANSYTQIANQVTEIQHLYTQVQQGWRNLQSLNLNNASDLLRYYQGVQSLLGQAQYITYAIGQSRAQAESYYARVEGLLSREQVTAFWQRSAAVQRDGALVAVSVQSITQRQDDLAAKNRELLDRIASSQGNLDTLQGLGQMQGLQTTELLNIEQQIATQGRLQAMDMLEKAAMKEAAANALNEASGTVTQDQPNGRYLRLSR